MKGSKILAEGTPKGMFLYGLIGDTSKPGTMMQIKAATEPVNDLWTFVFYQPSADGDPRPLIVLLEDELQGQLFSTAYVSGTLCRCYMPAPGERLNMLVKDISGTGDTHAIGDRFKGDHTSGKLIVEGTSANRASFTNLETAAAPTADIWLLMMAQS